MPPAATHFFLYVSIQYCLDELSLQASRAPATQSVGYVSTLDVHVPPRAIHAALDFDEHVVRADPVIPAHSVRIVSIHCSTPDDGDGFVPVGGGVVPDSDDVLSFPHPGMRRKSRKSISIIFSLTTVTRLLATVHDETTIPMVIIIIMAIMDDDMVQ